MAGRAPITVAGNLPQDDTYSGIEPLRESLNTDPKQVRYAVIAFDVMHRKAITDTGEMVPTLRIRHIEPAAQEDALEVQKLLERLSEGRLGVLPLSEAEDGAEPDEEADQA